MADLLTPLLKLIQPEDGGSFDTWGIKLNSDLAKLDRFLGAPASVKLGIPSNGVIDLSAGGVWIHQVVADLSLSFVNVPPDDSGTSYVSHAVLILQDGGNFTVSWPSGVTWLSDNGAAPTLRTFDLVLVWATASGALYGAHLGQAINTEALADNAVTTAKIADGAVTPAKLGGAQGMGVRVQSPSGTTSPIVWNAPVTERPTGEWWSSATPTRLTVPAGFTGLALILARINYNVSSGNPDTTLRKNGTTSLVSGVPDAEVLLYLDAPSPGDYYELVRGGGAISGYASANWQIVRIS